MPLSARLPLSSCLYECQVMHQRLAPKRYGLRHALFMLYIDLDEIDRCSQQLRLFSRNHWNLYGFRDDVPNEMLLTNPLGVVISYCREDQAFEK